MNPQLSLSLSLSPGASMTPRLCAAQLSVRRVPCHALAHIITLDNAAPRIELYIDAQSGALCYMALCVAWRFVPRGALCRVALPGWRFSGLPMTLWRFLGCGALGGYNDTRSRRAGPRNRISQFQAAVYSETQGSTSRDEAPSLLL